MYQRGVTTALTVLLKRSYLPDSNAEHIFFLKVKDGYTIHSKSLIGWRHIQELQIFLSLIVTQVTKPLRASAKQVSNPIPVELPVTSAILLFSLLDMLQRMGD